VKNTQNQYKHKNIVSETLTKYLINFTILYKSFYSFITLYLMFKTYMMGIYSNKYRIII